VLADRESIALDRRNPGIDRGLDPTTGEVVLDDTGITLVLTDTTYADLDVSVDVGDGPAPLILLNGKAYGDAACPWPASTSGGRTLRVQRADQTVTLSIGGKEKKCSGPEGRVSVQFRSAGPTVRVRSIDVRRSP